MKKILVLLPLLILYFVFSCKKEDAPNKYASFSASTVEVPASQDKYGLRISSNLTTWTLSVDDKSPWARITGDASRDSSATIYIEMDKNLDTLKRTATFTITFMLEKEETRTVKLVQLGEPKAIIVDIDTLFVPALGGVQIVPINSNLEWSAVASKPFVAIESDGLTKSMVKKDLKLNFAPNNALGFRLTQITVKQKDVSFESNFIAYQYGLATITTDSLALVDLYNATDGANWIKKWDLHQPLKKWYGVTVSAVKSGQRVTQLNLAVNNLVGTIPASISGLSFLEELALQDNKLSGDIPGSIGDLYSLRYLYLYNNKLTGAIPATLSAIPFIDRIRLGGNLLSSDIPEELGNLKYLKIFSVENNNITGTLPEKLGASTVLENIYVQGNKLRGTIPSSYTKNVKWKTWSAQLYICPQQTGFGFYNCPR
ncbi:MAG: hypothetical protein RR277_07965 [Rikenellaceae bacterium]